MDRLSLYVKTWCPWCVAAKKALDERGFAYEEIDVEASKEAHAEMIRISGQRLTPTLVVGDKVLPDFGPDELPGFFDRHGIKP
ncbi:MAG: glutaredoxin family protein [Verrucomicrobiota bacterium]